MLKPPKSKLFSGTPTQQLESSVRFAQVSFEGAERLIRLQMDTARRALDESAEIANALAGRKDPQEIMSPRTRLATQNTAALLNTSKQIYDTAVESRERPMEMLNEDAGAVAKDGAATVQKAIASMAEGESPWNAMQTVMAAATSAADHLFRLAGQASASAGFPATAPDDADSDTRERR
jgi:phasin family protein